MKKTMTNAKPALDVTGLSDDDLLEHLNALHDGMLNTPSYSDPTVDMAGLKAAIDALAVAAADARTGGKAAIIERDKRRAEAIAMFCRFGDANLLPEPSACRYCRHSVDDSNTGSLASGSATRLLDEERRSLYPAPGRSGRNPQGAATSPSPVHCGAGKSQKRDARVSHPAHSPVR